MMKRRVHRGFSLIELLLAIFILGIGVISIATLFPAGIAQQLKTTDDVIGPIVARNALSI
ncbi:MAG: prepilin-type N-terminal cleavage/methylation domain-containing protein, partial [Phycisphaerae bacterium]|nr:prepilin-type N-terminal cleavage/methylation domain-containing protein [Phycisphaerae bacterium]